VIAAMIIAALEPQTAVDAERAFAAAAQTEGQWSAFRAFAAPEAVLFVPQEVNAQRWLAGRQDPPFSVMWWPGEAWLSCDGTTAVTTGPWVRGGGRSVGYFTTVWQRRPGGRWQWLLDHGDMLEQPRPAADRPAVHRASCGSLPRSVPMAGQQGHEFASSPDRSLVWRWNVYENGARIVWAELWDGTRYRLILQDRVEAPGP